MFGRWWWVRVLAPAVGAAACFGLALYYAFSAIQHAADHACDRHADITLTAEDGSPVMARLCCPPSPSSACEWRIP